MQVILEGVIFAGVTQKHMGIIFFQVHGEENIPCNLTAQLIWREFFYCMAYENLNYNKMENNPICLRIQWYKDDEKLEKWAKVTLVLRGGLLSQYSNVF